MSLEAIFDPMVNAYFKKKYSGGGGETVGGGKVLCWDRTTHESGLPQMNLDGVFYRVADYADVTSLEGAEIFCWTGDLFATVGTFSTADGTLVTEAVEGVDPAVVGMVGSGTFLFVSVPEWFAVELGGQAGLYMAEVVLTQYPATMFAYNGASVTLIK